MDNKNTFVIAILVLIGSLGLGIGIRHIRKSLAVAEIKPASTQHEVVMDHKPVLEPDIDPELELEEELRKEFEVEPQMEFEAEEQDTIAFEEPTIAEPVRETEEVVTIVDQEQEFAEPEPKGQQWQFGSNFGSIQQFFDDLNLNEEELARLQEGLMLRRQQFERMSEQEQQAEFERIRDMGERWQNTSEQERDMVKRRMWDRYEDWRRSDSIDLPRLSLD